MPEGMSIKPDGVNEMDPCIYETMQVFTNCTVEISRCSRCGNIEVSWYRTFETAEVPEEYWSDYLIALGDIET